MELEHIKWRQHAKSNWYSLGDQNTRIFHAFASQRKKKNQIFSMINEDNRLISSPSELEGVFIGYFQNLFNSSNPTHANLEDCLKIIEIKVTSEINHQLSNQFIEMEIQEVIHHMARLKSSRPNRFYQEYWQLIGKDVCTATIRFLNEGVFDIGINYTFIVLVPKVKNPQTAGDYQSISLCNVAYKLISKTLANHLKQILPSIVSTEQSAFLPNQLIPDYFILAYETMHSRSIGRRGHRELWP